MRLGVFAYPPETVYSFRGICKNPQFRTDKPTALVEAAHAASHCKECYLSAHYHHIAAHRGKKRAAVALGHTLLIIIYHLLSKEKDYEELGGDYLDHVDRQGKEKRLVHQLEKLGFEVSLNPASPAA